MLVEDWLLLIAEGLARLDRAYKISSPVKVQMTKLTQKKKTGKILIKRSIDALLERISVAFFLQKIKN